MKLHACLRCTSRNVNLAVYSSSEMVAHSLLFSLEKEIPQRIFQNLSGDMPLAGIQSNRRRKAKPPIVSCSIAFHFQSKARALYVGLAKRVQAVPKK